MAFLHKNGPGGCAMQMGTILEASLWDSAAKPLPQVPALVLMEIWAGKMAGNCNSSSLKSLKMVSCGHQCSSLLFTSTSSTVLAPSWILPQIAFSAVRVHRPEANTNCFEVHLWLSGRKGVLPPASLASQRVQGLVIFTLRNSGGSSWFPGVTLMKRSRKINS